MVKKLFKHEFKYYLKSYIIFLPFLILIALFNKFLMLFESKITIIQIASYFSYTALVFGCFACMILGIIVSLVRYYKNMFTQEGYLTLTLPVTNFQHLLVKVVTSFTALALGVITILLSIFIIIPNYSAFFAGFTEFFEGYFTKSNLFLSIFSFLLLFISIIVMGVYYIMLYFGCITVGQMSKKNRIMTSIGAYFAYYFGTQIVGTILLIAYLVLSEFGLFDGLGILIYSEPNFILILTSLIIFVIYGGQIVLFYFIIMKILNSKLNLE